MSGPVVQPGQTLTLATRVANAQNNAIRGVCTFTNETNTEAQGFLNGSNLLFSNPQEELKFRGTFQKEYSAIIPDKTKEYQFRVSNTSHVPFRVACTTENTRPQVCVKLDNTGGVHLIKGIVLNNCPPGATDARQCSPSGDTFNTKSFAGNIGVLVTDQQVAHVQLVTNATNLNDNTIYRIPNGNMLHVGGSTVFNATSDYIEPGNCYGR